MRFKELGQNFYKTQLGKIIRKEERNMFNKVEKKQMKT